MAQWRIRVGLSDDPKTRARLAELLAEQQVSAVELTPCPGAASPLVGEVVLELPRDEELGDMLSALHTLSPQVFVSRVAAGPDSQAGLPRQRPARRKPSPAPPDRGALTAAGS